MSYIISYVQKPITCTILYTIILYDIVCCIYDIVCLTYDVVYDIASWQTPLTAHTISFMLHDVVYDISYPKKIEYNILLFKMYFLPAGPAPHPSAPPSDAGDNPPWNSDDESDFAEQAYSPPSPM
jgi:hypothetical protein